MCKIKLDMENYWVFIKIIGGFSRRAAAKAADNYPSAVFARIIIHDKLPPDAILNYWHQKPV